MPRHDHHDVSKPGRHRPDSANAEVLRAVQALELQLRRVRTDIDALIEEVGVANPQADAAAVGTPDLLTPAEQRVLDLLPSGLTRGQIAVKLYVSPNTVKTHVSRIYRAFGVSTREDAVAVARADGYLAPVRSPTCEGRRLTARIR